MPSLPLPQRLQQLLSGAIASAVLFTPAPTFAAATHYEKAQQELPQDIYLLYRIIDRVSRANGLDELAWRVSIIPQYDANAFSTEVNRIALATGVMDQLAGDFSAIACLVGHEMAHHTQRHGTLRATQTAAMQAQLQQATTAAINREVNRANRTATATTILGGIAGMFGGTAGVIGGTVLRGAGQGRLARLPQRVEAIVAKKEAELEKQLLAQTHQQEFEADEHGYLYMARAGFEPGGCLRALEVLARTPGAVATPSQPTVPQRLDRLQTVMQKQPASGLVATGRAKIDETLPLTYHFFTDQRSLRINSRFTQGSTTDFDRFFGSPPAPSSQEQGGSAI